MIRLDSGVRRNDENRINQCLPNGHGSESFPGLMTPHCRSDLRVANSAAKVAAKANWENHAEIIVLNGNVSQIRYTPVMGRAPLVLAEMRYFEEVVSAKADEIVQKWIDFFVLHKTIKPEHITRRLK